LLVAAAADLSPGILPEAPSVALLHRLVGRGGWTALCPHAPLRRWRLVEIEGAGPLSSRLLRINERILSHLIGVDYCDVRLDGFVELLGVGGLDAELATAAEQLTGRWIADRDGRFPLLTLCGGTASERRRIAALTLARMGMRPFALDRTQLPRAAYERVALLRLCEREMLLANGGLVIVGEHGDSAEESATRLFVDSVDVPTILVSQDPPSGLSRATIRAELPGTSISARSDQWQRALGDAVFRVPDDLCDRLARQFTLESREIESAVAAAGIQSANGRPAADRLWEAARVHARRRLHALAEQITPCASWDDIVLPPDRIEQLREVAVHVRRAWQVEEKWGWAARGRRGLGMTALFTGPSGTGKTMAAEVLANELRLDLYRIDLSQVISKYIGDTEKNLNRIFDAAEANGAILLFDEADALFGKRSEVKDSHDRYANVEISYLLQRMEAYRGPAILTTNFRSSLDPAFLRRLRFVIEFPFPDANQRATIWDKIFPEQTPLANVDSARLARLALAGGAIRTIAINAAYSAAEEGSAVTQRHILAAARREYAKLDKPVTAAEFGGRA
jgi:vesicle-fusing ATPase